MSFPFLLLFRRLCSTNSAIESSGGGGRRSGKFTIDETSLFLFSLPVRVKPKKKKKKNRAKQLITIAIQAVNAVQFIVPLRLINNF
ncbi:unnamed protein product [Rotaria socialis]